jgi:hypothetical protein
MTMTRLLAAVAFLGLVGCGGTTKKKTDNLIEDEQAGENCCCRIETDDPEDPTFANVAVMECSSRHGECLQAATQCEGQPDPVEPDSTDSGSLPPVVEETPNAF